MILLRKILREPLLHFLIIGLLLFALFGKINGSQAGADNRIVITSAMVNQLAQGYQATWQRPPSVVELKGLVDGYVREELMYREGLALKLDQDDPVIRRRMTQKMEVIAEESSEQTVADDAELERYLSSNAERYALPSVVSFQQVFFDPASHGDQLDAQVAEALVRLQAGESLEQVGDRTQLPAAVGPIPDDLLARDFGKQFAETVAGLPLDQWSGPVFSGFGVHLVRLTSLTPGRPATLAEVRRTVQRDWESDRRAQAKEAFYEDLLKRYEVVVEVAPEATPDAMADAGVRP